MNLFGKLLPKKNVSIVREIVTEKKNCSSDYVHQFVHVNVSD